jgi:hypothetical protein
VYKFRWIRKGYNKHVKTNFGRKRVNINAAIDAKNPTQRFFDESNSIDALSTVRLIKAIEKVYPAQRIIVAIADNARHYHSKTVREYQKTSRVSILHLTPYYPNLNLIE